MVRAATLMKSSPIWIATVIGVALAANATAQTRGALPYKMILREGQMMTVIDYASRARCEAAKVIIEQENGQKQADARRRMEAAQGNIIISPTLLRATCVPG
jgi:hypothetical protein